MASFDIYKPRLKRWEGNKYANRPSDEGGPTNSGITLDTFRQFFGQDKTIADLKALTESQWMTVMKGGFWDKCKADQIRNQSIAEIFVDWCINSGIGKIRFVQQMVGTTVDGIVGPKTIAAINRANQEALHRQIKFTRAKRYIAQIEAKPFNMENFNGWFNRLIDFNYKK